MRFGHPSGTLRVGARGQAGDGQWQVTKAVMSRSARILMEGWVRVPADTSRPALGSIPLRFSRFPLVSFQGATRMTTEQQPPPSSPRKSVALSGVPPATPRCAPSGKTGNDLHYRGYDILDLADSLRI